MKRIILTAPNFSEGRDQEKIQKILDCFRNREHVQILRWQGDPDHNRFGANVIGEPEAIYEAMLEAIGTALELIDMTKHHGQHPRMGAVDVIPLTPLRNCTIEDCSELAHKIASEAADKYHLPFFLYEKSANTPARTNLAEIRKGEFEGMAEKTEKS
ncbi:glutamate formiminotransferase [[Clostridium] symbiosum]|uniref:glutamate formiminotransferase n=1 Tax=Clostridium symbiosum TaxID=1512 RepID=UPI0001FAB463|nr:glutamate formiminotransferase [[Clostridium] symbiosum]EGB18706.1 formiminotransferase domain, N-terminal subdomain protein [[Clostridium] symbiosum WAL-14673]